MNFISITNNLQRTNQDKPHENASTVFLLLSLRLNKFAIPLIILSYGQQKRPPNGNSDGLFCFGNK